MTKRVGLKQAAAKKVVTVAKTLKTVVSDALKPKRKKRGKKKRRHREPHFVQGGAPGLGKRR